MVTRLWSRDAGVMTLPGFRAARLHGLASCLIVFSACAPASGPLQAVLDPDHGSGKAVVRVTGLSKTELVSLDVAGWGVGAEAPPVTVRVEGPNDLPPVSGRYAVEGADLIFSPLFGFDPGRAYRVDVDTSRLTDRTDGAVVTIVRLPAIERLPTAEVARVLPSAEVWPENALRFYVEFTRPMSRSGGLAYVRLLDDSGREVVDPFLPLDVAFWNPDYTRFTFFLDPGRVKRDILPNREMGRALVAGRTYTLEVAAEWRDADGQPLVRPYARTVRIGPADESPVDPTAWTIEVPGSGTRSPLVVRFPEPLDHGLLSRAVGLASEGGEFLPGEVTIDAGETSWRFTPRDPWRAGDYDVVVLSILEDIAGNRVGRPFEVDRFDRVDDEPEPERVTRRFRIPRVAPSEG